jgi:hypothetical protein
MDVTVAGDKFFITSDLPVSGSIVDHICNAIRVQGGQLSRPSDRKPTLRLPLTHTLAGIAMAACMQRHALTGAVHGGVMTAECRMSCTSLIVASASAPSRQVGSTPWVSCCSCLIVGNCSDLASFVTVRGLLQSR